MSLSEIAARLNEKVPQHSQVCSYCGQRASRTLVGVQWMGVHEVLGFDPGVPAAGFLPCAVLTCSACGNLWVLNLLVLGIVKIEATHPKPTFTLIQGGRDDVAGPDGPEGRGP